MPSDIIARGRRVLVIANDRGYFLHHRRAVVERLTELGASVTVLAGGAPPQAGEDTGWTSHHLPIDRLSIDPFSNLLLLWRCLRRFRSERPDVAHLLTLKPAVFGGLAALLARMAGRGPERILITIPGLGRLMSPGGTGAGRLSRLVRSAVGGVVRFLSGRRGIRFSFETAHDRDIWLREGYIRPDNSVVINGAGCDPRLFFPSPDGIPAGRLRVLFASRLLRSKGLSEFVAAARLLAASPVDFIVAGMADAADPDTYPPEELAREPSITFIGVVKDMPALIRSVGIVCLPTRYGEGVPRILIEAAASGVACLASDIAGCKAIVEHGVTGTLIPAADAAGMPAALATAVKAYLDHPAMLARHGAAGLERFRSHGFSQDAVVAAFVEQLLGGIGEQRPR